MVRKMGVFGPAQRANVDTIFALVEPGQAIDFMQMPDTQRDAHVRGLPRCGRSHIPPTQPSPKPSPKSSLTHGLPPASAFASSLGIRNSTTGILWNKFLAIIVCVLHYKSIPCEILPCWRLRSRWNARKFDRTVEGFANGCNWVIFWVRRSIQMKLTPNLTSPSERIAFAIHSNHLIIRSMTTTKVPMSIRLDVNAQERLRAIAARQKRSAHALATEAIDQLIEQKEREYAWHQSCDGALKHFDETGLHATHEEVMAWMGKWGTDKESPAPLCHR